MSRLMSLLEEAHLMSDRVSETEVHVQLLESGQVHSLRILPLGFGWYVRGGWGSESLLPSNKCALACARSVSPASLREAGAIVIFVS